METFSLVLPNIRSCHNVGAMFRTADACGFEKLYLCGYTATPPKPQIDKVSLGAETWIPWEQHNAVLPLLQSLKEKGILLVALEKSEISQELSTYILPDQPMALVLGNEVDGVSQEVLDICDAIVHIDMKGKKESLNVSIAAGIAMYELGNKK